VSIAKVKLTDHGKHAETVGTASLKKWVIGGVICPYGGFLLEVMAHAI
jgi:hypothetical protein